jgi:hypothetical protein
MSDLVRYLYREHDAEDPRVMEEGLANLNALLDEVDLDAATVDRSWVPDLLDSTDVADVSRPEGRDLDALLSISVAGSSTHPATAHALLQIQTDQTAAEPTATHYERTIDEPDSPDCFASGDCTRLRTINDARRENFLMSVDFILFKDFVWSHVGTEEEVGTDRPRAIAARSYFAESFPGDAGNTMLWQSYSLDLWIEDENGGSRRFQSLWSESDIIDVDEDIVRNVLRDSIDDVYAAGDEAIDQLLAAE